MTGVSEKAGEKHMKKIVTISIIMVAVILSIIGYSYEISLKNQKSNIKENVSVESDEKNVETDTSDVSENTDKSNTTDVSEKNVAAPTKQEVEAAREECLAGMNSAQTEELTNRIKDLNDEWTSKFMYQDWEQKLVDSHSLEWNVFMQTGEIQVGWAYDSGTPDM